MINELDLLWLPNFIALGIYFIFGTNFRGMRGLILVLMSNVCYLAVILTACYWWLLLVTALHCLFPLLGSNGITDNDIAEHSFKLFSSKTIIVVGILNFLGVVSLKIMER